MAEAGTTSPSAAQPRVAYREDHALDPVPSPGGRLGTGSLFAAVMGIPSALVFFAVGGGLGQAYGTVNLLTGLVVASVIIGVAGWVLTSFACRSGLDSDLMSISAGFGKLGSAATSAIYSVNFVMLFALETSIIGSAVHTIYPGFPQVPLFAAVGLVVLALAWYGIRSVATAMKLTLPFFLVFLVLAVIEVGGRDAPGSFWSYAPPHSTLDPTAWLLVLAALLAFVVNATVAADVGRFLRPQSRRAGSFLFGGVLQLVAFGGATLLGAWFSFRLHGETDPGAYLVSMFGGWGIVCVLLSQIRINVINAYSGSLSLSNFGARGLGMRPGRHIWMLGLVGVSTALAMTNFSQHLLGILTFEAVFVMSWVSTLVAYIVQYDLNFSERSAREAFANAPMLNAVGLGSLALALAVATPLAFGAGGELGRGLAPLAAMVAAPIGVLALGRLVSIQASQASSV
jgi:hypothetical protein